MNKAELASLLRRFIGDAPDCGNWEWDDFVSVSAEPELEPYRLRLLNEVAPLLGDEARINDVSAVIREIAAELEVSK
ncbi:MAG: hypothetical protein U0995_02510 [Erythrobacter sp.]|nr:hypothetical protein [Erythrobacter sp.]